MSVHHYLDCQQLLLLNPLPAPARKFSGLKSAHIHACKQPIGWPVTTLLSVLCVLVEVLSRARAKSGESLNGFKFGTSVSRFSSDAAASTAVKGLSVVRTEKKGNVCIRKAHVLFFYGVLQVGECGESGAVGTSREV